MYVCRYAIDFIQNMTSWLTVFVIFLSHFRQCQNSIVTDLLKALLDSGRQTVDCLGSGHVVPQQDDATVLWSRFLRVSACT
jgi:hypothetical protein